MIEGIYKIGSVQPEKDFLEDFIDDIGDDYKHVFKIKIDITNKDEFIYIGIDYEQYDSSKKMKYFYKKGSSRGTDKTPTSKITTIEKTLDTKIFPIFVKIVEENKKILSNEDKKFLEEINTTITNNKETIQQNLKDKLNEIGELKAKNGGIVTFLFVDNGKEFYVGDLDIFRNLFKQNENIAYKDFYYSKSNKVYSKAENKKCYICGKEADEVWGFVNTYNFYNVDKESYVAGGLNRANAWKNYPVCSKCAKILEKGKRYADEHLIFKFCGFNYYIIPNLLLDDDKTLKDILTKLKTYRDFSLNDKKSALIERVEEYILRKLSDESNQINFDFVFFETSNSAFKILLYMQEIAPTRLKFLIESKDKVDKRDNKKFDIFKELQTKKDLIRLDFSFNFIREFFPNSKFDGKFNKYFLSILNNIFIDKNVSADFLYNRFIDKLSQVFLNDDWLEPWVLKSYKILLYLDEINQLEKKGGDMRNYENDFETFFKEHPLINDSVRKALFLEGVLAKKLLNIQYQERNATPFRSRLNGLKIDEKVAKRLLPEIINKLEEYRKNYYIKLEEAIGEYLLNSDFKKYSIDEMSYWFTLGMVLAKHFSFNEEKQDNLSETTI